jgi:hypothetical protein
MIYWTADATPEGKNSTVESKSPSVIRPKTGRSAAGGIRVATQVSDYGSPSSLITLWLLTWGL